MTLKKYLVLIILALFFIPPAFFAIYDGTRGLKTISGETNKQVHEESYSLPLPYLKDPISGELNRLPVLMFHTVNTNKEVLEPISPNHFETIMQDLKQKGFVTITAKQAHDYNVNKVPLQNNPIWITFDDGWLDNLTYAAPIMQKYGFFATIFVEVSKMGEKHRATLKQLKTLHDTYGWDIQSHGYEGHFPLEIGPGHKTGNYYSDIKYIAEQNRYETMDERNARVFSDLEKSKETLAVINPTYAFAYPAGLDGSNESILAANDAILSQLDMVGIRVGLYTREQIVNTLYTPTHRLARIGISNNSTVNDIISIYNFGLAIRNKDGDNANAKFLAYDSVRDRILAGDSKGKVYIVGRDWRIINEPIQVEPPVGSAASMPESYILPTILPNGDVWVGSITSKRLYKLNPENLGGPALKEVILDFYPYIVINDGTNVYAGDEKGVIKKIDLTTLAITIYCSLPGTDGRYEQGILKDGILYVGDKKMQGITIYDFFAKQVIETWMLSIINTNMTKFYPWHVIDRNNITCYEDVSRRVIVINRPDIK